MANRWNLVVLSLLVAGIAVFFGRQRVEQPSPSPSLSASPAVPEAFTPPAASGPSELPNLVITDIFFEEPYFKVHYMNAGGANPSSDFQISWRSVKKTFKGNHFYRFQVPAPNDERSSGGLTVGLVGAQQGVPIEVTVEIDSENRVAESNESDNAKSVVLTPGVGGSNREKLKTVKPSYSVKPEHWKEVDLIVTDAQLADGAITVQYTNQGAATVDTDFEAQLGRRRGDKETISGLGVPAPGATQSFKVEVMGWEPTDIVEIVLDPKDEVAEGRENNNTFYRQLDRTHDLNGRPAK